MTTSARGYEVRVEDNPNPLRTCFCGQGSDCPGGPGWTSPNEIEGPPGNYTNYISDACNARLLASTDVEVQRSAPDAGANGLYHGPEVGEDGKWLAPWPPGQAPSWYERPAVDAASVYRDAVEPGPEPHENPTAPSFEEAQRLIDEQAAAQLEDDPLS